MTGMSRGADDTTAVKRRRARSRPVPRHSEHKASRTAWRLAEGMHTHTGPRYKGNARRVLLPRRWGTSHKACLVASQVCGNLAGVQKWWQD